MIIIQRNSPRNVPGVAMANTSLGRKHRVRTLGDLTNAWHTGHTTNIKRMTHGALRGHNKYKTQALWGCKRGGQIFETRQGEHIAAAQGLNVPATKIRWRICWLIKRQWTTSPQDHILRNAENKDIQDSVFCLFLFFWTRLGQLNKEKRCRTRALEIFIIFL